MPQCPAGAEHLLPYAPGVASPDNIRDETALERADRNLGELLQELRVILPGVQVLFAFLLTVPFSDRFGTLSDFHTNLYFAILLSTAVTMALLVAPTANHRLLFHKRDKVYSVKVANRLAVAGITFLALSVCAVVLLISDLLFDSSAAVLSTAGIGAVFAVLWFVGPMMRRRRLADRQNGR